MAYFVYVEKNGQVFPQRFDIWPTVDGKPMEVLQSYEIDQRDMGSKMSALMDKYPYKPIKDLT